MSRMTKAEFLGRLVTAVTRMRQRIEPITQNVITLMASDNVTMAWGWANDMEIFIEDASHKAWLDNPVVQAVEFLGSFPEGQPLTLEQYSMVEAAWEYFHRKQLGNVPYLYWDGNTKKWFLSDKPDWNSHNFVCFARN